MGTPEFAVSILDAIYTNGYNIVGVITAPDKPAGRGQKLNESAVKKYALEKNLKILQPTNLKNEGFLEELKSLEANLQVVVAFRMLPEVVWKMPKLGTFNLHASLLPNYRGAAPINWAIINGETQTGVSTFFIDDKIDTGAIILKREIPIYENENAGELHDRLMQLGSKAVIETLEQISNNKVILTHQLDSDDMKTAYKLNKENCQIDWHKSSQEIVNIIRGLSPYPTAWTWFWNENEKLNVKIYEAKSIKENHNHEIGKLFFTKKEIKVAIKDGFIELLSLQLPGKKRMKSFELMNGISLSASAKCL